MAAGQPDPGRMREVECTLQNSHGETIPIRKLGRILMNSDGDAVGILMILVDLRPLRRLEEQISGIEAFERNEPPPGKLVGVSPAMQVVYNRIRLAAKSDVTVLIEGETGTGKELVVEAIHSLSSRRNKPLVKVNCSALSENLLESELFGHVKGSFTGAVKDKAGRIEMAEGGTLFLDEIGDISPLIQLKLLRVLQEHEYERVGDSGVRRADVRFIAATHRDLKARVNQEIFREDFYYRICVYSIQVAALREHKADIPLLCDSFITKMNHKTGKNIQRLTEEGAACLMDYCWPGNVRQLENAIEHAFVMCFGESITIDDLPDEIRDNRRQSIQCSPRKPELDLYDIPPRRPQITQEVLVNTLKLCHWNQSETARRLGVDRTTIWRKMKRWKIEEN
jgi:transcriptional regulator with PAS, ATPase and Fis domain